MITRLPMCLIFSVNLTFPLSPLCINTHFLFAFPTSLLLLSFFSLAYFCPPSPLRLSLPTGYGGPFLMRTLDLSRSFTMAQYCIIYHSA